MNEGEKTAEKTAGKPMAMNGPLIGSQNELLGTRIHCIRDKNVILDSDLANAYQVTTKQLNQAVNRNPRRFPDAYSFQLKENEWDALRSQSVTSNMGRGGRRYLPRVFTESGAVALATVLNSERAIAASIIIIDAFVRFRHLLENNRELSRRIDELAAKYDKHDRAITLLFHEFRKLVTGFSSPAEPEKPKGRIGFRTSKDKPDNQDGSKAKSNPKK